MRPSVAILLVGTAIYFSSSGGHFASVAQGITVPGATQVPPQGPAAPAPLAQAQVDAEPAAEPAEPAPSPAVPTVVGQATPLPTDAQGNPQVDESALRYFARQGDTKRLEAEIARLRALYPGWEPPADPLAEPAVVDEQLDNMWRLYGKGRMAEVRKAIADRQAAEPGWTPPQDLLDRLALGETRQRIVNASNLKQFETVIREASASPALLTCGDVDVLWRVAEAFASTERPERALDAYRYVLQNCSDPAERLATVQKSVGTLPRADVEALLALAEQGAGADQDFTPVRNDLARQSLADAGADPKLRVSPADLATVKRLAEEENKASDSLLLGWYYIRRDGAADAETWFRRADEAEDTAQSSQGLALALIALRRPVEAEAALVDWRSENDDTRAVYMAAVANMLAIVPPLDIPEQKLAQIAGAVAESRDAAAAQQFGWYADALNQFPTAAQWFRTALGWKPDDEPSAYGLALMHWKLGDQAGVRVVQQIWAGRSQRIATVGQPEPLTPRPLAPGLAPIAGQPVQMDPNRYGANALSAYSTDGMAQGQPVAQSPVGGEQAPGQNQAVTQYPPVAQYVAPGQANLAAQYPEQYPAPQQYPAATQQYPAAPMAQGMATQYPPAVQYQAPVQNAPVVQYQQPVQYQAPAQYPGQAAPEVQPRREARVQRTETTETAPRVQASGGGGDTRGCTTTVNPERLSPRAALTRGWCLMDRRRPMEAALAFDRALLSESAKDREDAAYGQSLAYLEAGLTDKAAVSAIRAPQSPRRSTELQTSLLAARANSLFEASRYAEAISALDQRARIAPELTGLMVLRGYSYLALEHYDSAEEVFRAAALTGDREARKGLILTQTRRREAYRDTPRR
ncbi:MAG: cellulose synthase [Mesorhizobium amorphae]|nr:MAG: cellulose synthase [Mesorhizobium amorphae]